MKRIKYWFIRLLWGRIAFKVDLPFHIDKKVGDVVVSGKRDLEYIGAGKYLVVSETATTKMPLGWRINNYLKSGGRASNQFVMRDGKSIAGKVKPKRRKRRNTNKKI